MVDYKEWFSNAKDLSPLGKCIVYKQTRLEKLFAKTLPYIMPFISKRRRVAIRNYWKYRHKRRACTALCKLLMEQELEKRRKECCVQIEKNTRLIVLLEEKIYKK